MNEIEKTIEKVVEKTMQKELSNINDSSNCFNITTAILVDGGFYRRRAQSLWGEKDSKERANELYDYCKNHLFRKGEKNYLYRIFYYDCPPSAKKIYHPYLKNQLDLSTTPLYNWTNDFFAELKRKRKFAIRLGNLADSQAYYSLDKDTIKDLCDGTITFDKLTERDFILNLDQKGVDMKIGVDIASIAFKKQVNRIVLISGDSDFVPAAKLARREGIDFILDSMGAHVKADLSEHIDGMCTYYRNPDFWKKFQN